MDLGDWLRSVCFGGLSTTGDRRWSRRITSYMDSDLLA